MLVAPESLPRTQHTGNTDSTLNISLLDMPRSNQGNTSRSPNLDHSACDQSHQFPRQLLELEGITVKNRLRLGSILGNGAFGVVYVGVGPRYANNRPVAVKVTSTARIDKERRRQIEYEILCHNRVSEHPNVVTLLGVLENLSAKYSIMDLYSEGDLFKCITEDELYVGNDTMIKGVFSQLLDAVEFCHAKGVYHRDLKPENVLCSNRGNRVLLTDFGLATLHPLSKEFRCGSEFYMSPECMGFPKAEAYSTLHNDIWALGVILVNLITSRNPWRCADPADRAFALFREDPIGYIRSTLPVSPEVLALLLRIFKIPSKSRISIAGIRKAIGGMDRLLLTPSDAAAAPDAAYEAAVSLYGVIAARRPYLLADHYEDICVHYPELAEGLCANLKVQMAEHGLIDSVDDIFSEHASGVVYHVPQGLPEWSIPVEIRPEQLDEVSGYPQSPDMSRDNSTETIASGGPVTPATHPTQVVDEVPEIVLGEVDCVTEDLDALKVEDPATRTPVAPSGFSSRIARMLGSTGSFFR